MPEEVWLDAEDFDASLSLPVIAIYLTYPSGPWCTVPRLPIIIASKIMAAVAMGLLTAHLTLL